MLGLAMPPIFECLFKSLPVIVQQDLMLDHPLFGQFLSMADESIASGALLHGPDAGCPVIPL